jgi:hypothetical protein
MTSQILHTGGVSEYPSIRICQLPVLCAFRFLYHNSKLKVLLSVNDGAILHTLTAVFTGIVFKQQTFIFP